MSKNYETVSRAIVDALGGLENIEAVTHCMTRLRFVVKDKTQVVDWPHRSPDTSPLLK